ncbi:MAG: acetate--CoA ligase [Calditrichaeota bacterium]|nr:acetate--CoA ligase [Calditrichota bacterium]MBT7617913.1 acetate--CoA ligase [Calditrichota bacterium]
MSQSGHKLTSIDTLLTEEREFKPTAKFQAQANANDQEIYEKATSNPEAFWERYARELVWRKPWDKVLDWNPPDSKWFVGGKLNITESCLDVHIKTDARNKAALIWEGEPGDKRTLTYWDLYREVCRFANALKSLGVKKGDRVALYMPMIPELVIAVLSCARIGAIHSVVFGGFSAEALSERINDAEAKVLITADGGYRRGQIVQLKHDADEALKDCPSIEHVVVVKRGNFPIHFQENRDHWWHRLIDEADFNCPAEEMDSEDPLYILYTSGTTGKPKGIMHTIAGYLVGVYATTKLVFDLKPNDCYWCTADIGWVTGHSYIVYGPLSNGATQVMYEGAPNWPDPDRVWKIVENHGVTVFYTAPTAIRAFMKWGEKWTVKHDLSSLRLLGTVGEPINPEAWMWYHKHIGGEKCPIVDTWWQTETGHIMIAPLPGLITTKPGSATQPFPSIKAAILDDDGNEVEHGGGYLAILEPWPGMLRTIWGDHDRYIETYWSKWKNIYFPGDGAKIDKDSYYWILGRIDDVINVAGHRLSTMEIESALVDHNSVVESAVVGITHELKGQGIVAFVTVGGDIRTSPELVDILKAHVVKKIGALARPEQIIFAHDLPKTRSGKIMRRLLRDIASGSVLGDVTTLADPTVVEELKRKYEED